MYYRVYRGKFKVPLNRGEKLPTFTFFNSKTSDEFQPTLSSTNDDKVAGHLESIKLPQSIPFSENLLELTLP